MQRKYKIILIIVIVILIAIGGYFAFQSLTSPSTIPSVDETSTTTDVTGGDEDPTQEGDEDEGDEVTQEEPQIPILISDEANNVFDFWVNESTDEINYITLSGNIYSAKEGPDPEISTQQISALNFIEQSPSGDFILAAFGDPKGPEFGVFDIIDEVWRPIPSSIDKATWTTDNNLIVVRETSTVRTLEVVELDNGSLNESALGNNIIFNNFGLRDITMEVVDDSRLMITEKPASFYEGRLWEVNLNEATITNLIEGENGLTVNWSNDYLFKFNSPDNFFILNHNLESAVPVFFKTLPYKCGQGENNVVCGVAQNDITNKNNLPESYLQKEFFTIDELRQVDYETLESKTVFESGTEDIKVMDIKNPRVSNGNVYFLDRYGDGLYRVSL